MRKKERGREKLGDRVRENERGMEGERERKWGREC